jgi:hypothetical protein
MHAGRLFVGGTQMLRPPLTGAASRLQNAHQAGRETKRARGLGETKATGSVNVLRHTATASNRQLARSWRAAALQLPDLLVGLLPRRRLPRADRRPLI